MGTAVLERMELTGVVRPVLQAPHPVLSALGAPVDPCHLATVALVADLIATMRVSPGCVGLAAPQIGQAVQVFVVDLTGHPRAYSCHGLLALCNARLVQASQWGKGREGCLSVPDLTGDVKRAGRVVVAGELPGSGEPVEVVADGFEARALQHEIDHCHGQLFLNRAVGPHAIHPRKVYL
jgi:peptide deformylase